MAAAGSSSTYGLSLVELLDDGWHTRSVWETPETLPCLPKTVSPAAPGIHHRLSLDEYADYANTTLFPLPKDQEEGYLTARPAHPTFSRQHSDGLIITSHMDVLSMSIMTQSSAADQPLPVLLTSQLIATSASSDRVLRQPSNCIQYAATRSSSSSTTTAIPPTTNDNHPEINPMITENTAASAPEITPADGVAYRSSAMQAAVRPRTSLYGGKGKPGSMMFGMSMSAMDVFHMEVEVNQRGEDTAHGGWRQRQESLTGMGMEESTLEDAGEHGSRHGTGRQRELPVSQLMAMLKQQAGGNKHPQPPAQLVAAPIQQRSFNPPVQPSQPAQQQQGLGHASLHKAHPKDVSRGAPAVVGTVQQARDQIASDAATQPTHRRPEHEWDDSAHRAHQSAKGGAKQAAADVLAASLMLPPGQEECNAQTVTAQGRLLHATRTWADAASTAATSPSEVPAELVTMVSLPRSATLLPCMAYEGMAGVSVASNSEAGFVQGGSRTHAEFSFGVGAASSRPINTEMKPASITVVKRQIGSSGRYEVVPYPLYEPVHSNVPAHGHPIRVVGFNIRE